MVLLLNDTIMTIILLNMIIISNFVNYNFSMTIYCGEIIFFLVDTLECHSVVSVNTVLVVLIEINFGSIDGDQACVGWYFLKPTHTLPILHPSI